MKKIKWGGLPVALAMAAAGLGLAAAAKPSAKKDAPTKKEAAAKDASTKKDASAKPEDPAKAIKRGEYLVKIMACGDCHTPMQKTPAGTVEPNMSRFLSGASGTLLLPDPPKLPPGMWVTVSDATNTAFSGPWGISYAANLTPDTNTGMGIWTEQMFIDAMRQQKHMGTSRPILPPMPARAYARMSDGDLKAVFAYLKSIPPISNRVPEPKPADGKPAGPPAPPAPPAAPKPTAAAPKQTPNAPPAPAPQAAPAATPQGARSGKPPMNPPTATRPARKPMAGTPTPAPKK